MCRAASVFALVVAGCGEVREVPTGDGATIGADTGSGGSGGQTSGDRDTDTSDPTTGSESSGSVPGESQCFLEPMAIEPGSMQATLEARDLGIIADVDIGVRVLHEAPSDLALTIEHDGTTVTLLSNPTVPGCHNMDVFFDDEGEPLAGGCAAGEMLADRVIPAQPLSAFDGAASVGPWTLTADNAGDQPGSLSSLCLLVAR